MGVLDTPQALTASESSPVPHPMGQGCAGLILPSREEMADHIFQMPLLDSFSSTGTFPLPARMLQSLCSVQFKVFSLIASGLSSQNHSRDVTDDLGGARHKVLGGVTVCLNLMATPEVGLTEGEETVPSVPPCAISPVCTWGLKRPG